MLMGIPAACVGVAAAKYVMFVSLSPTNVVLPSDSRTDSSMTTELVSATPY